MQVAVQYEYHIEIMEPNTPWRLSEKKLAAKGIHSVPLESINRMKNKYESVKNVEQILRSLQLDIVRQPKMRSIPPIAKKMIPKAPEVKTDLIDFGLWTTSQGSEWKLYDHQPKKQVADNDIESQTPKPKLDQIVPEKKPESPPTNWRTFEQVFADAWEQPEEKVPTAAIEKEAPKKEVEPQPQKKKGKNKNRSPQSKLSPHRRNCPNENPSFMAIRELYPTVNDAYLWDFFAQCKGDADWCVNLLCDENLTDQMDAGNDLNCNCFGAEVTKPIATDVKENSAPNNQQAQQSPAVKKKAKTELSKQIDLFEWIETKESIENSITIGDEHYPEHVKMVKNWRNPKPIVETPVNDSEQPETPKASNSPDVDGELKALTIPKELITELDEEFGHCLKSFLSSKYKFPPKIFIQKSTAMQLYLEIMEAYYSQEEEARLEVIKNDEELAKKLNEQQLQEKLPKVSGKGSKKNSAAMRETLDFQAAIAQFEAEPTNIWKKEESSDDIALKMSKEKLIEMFPGINKDTLMEIFAGSNHNFKETVEFIQDSLNCTQKERAEIAQVQKIVFNTPWQETNVVNGRGDEKTEDVSADGSTYDGYTKEHLKTIENLRQAIQDHQEEQEVCYVKAQGAIQKKNFELATYLSNIASFHKMKADEAKHEVANMLAGIHENTQQSETTLDLHYFNLLEAVTLLDTFLDKNISRLRAIRKPYEEIHIITGRGSHSANGVPTIKIKTRKRLNERKLV